MANVLTDLAGDIYKAADIVARELTGFVPSSTINADGSERVALNDTVRAHFTRAAVAVNNVPSMTIPEGTDQTVDNKTLTISKSRGVQVPWTGEDMKSVNNGSGFETIYGDQIAQAMRTLTNEIERDLAIEAYTNSSRAVGIAGTTPFATKHDVINEARQILVDNGVPDDGQMSLIMNTSAGTKFRNLSNLYKVNEAGSDSLLRQGIMTDISNISIRESAQILLHTNGTGTGYLIDNGSGEVVGETTLTLDTGSGTIVVGDIVTFASDTANKYAVNTALVGGVTLVIGDPGIRDAAIPDSNALTVGADYTPNILMHRSALELAIRPPAMPAGGDAAVDDMIVQDPRSGLVFEIRAYKGFQKTMFNVSAAWGFKAWNSKYIATLMG